MRLLPKAQKKRIARISRSGAAAVEFAMVFPLFIVVILAMFELGRGYMNVHQLTEAARHGCREAILPNSSNTSIAAEVDVYINAIGLKGTTTTVQVNGTTANANTALADDLITVTVTAPISQNSWVPGSKYLTGTSLSGSFSMRHE